MGYLQDTDRWLDTLLADFADDKLLVAEVKRDLREKILESYKNGLKAREQSPAPRETERPRAPRRFPQRAQAA